MEEQKKENKKEYTVAEILKEFENDPSWEPDPAVRANIVKGISINLMY